MNYNKLYNLILDYEGEIEKAEWTPKYYWSEYYSDNPFNMLECRNARTGQELSEKEIEMLIV